MKDLETAILRATEDQLLTFSARLTKAGLRWEPPTLAVLNTSRERYSSEIRVTFLRGSNIEDVLEFFVYHEGRQQVTLDQATQWLWSELGKLVSN